MNLIDFIVGFIFVPFFILLVLLRIKKVEVDRQNSKAGVEKARVIALADKNHNVKINPYLAPSESGLHPPTLAWITYEDVFNETANGEPEMPKDDFITVVFECPSDSELRKEITTAFKDDKLYKGVQITAVSLTDEISRVERLEIESKSN